MDEKDHRKNEEEWFRKNEEQLLEAAREARAQRERDRAARETAEGLRKLKELHFMKCPKCGHDMKTESLAAIQVDRCTFCEGLFLDAGELEQLYRKHDSERGGFFRQILGV